MKFDRLKDSLNRLTFKKCSRASSIVLTEFSTPSNEETLEPSTPPTLQPSRSLKEILLPPIKRQKPLTITNFLAIGNSSNANTAILDRSDLTSPRLNNTSQLHLKSRQTRDTMRFPSTNSLLRRKAIGESSGYTPPAPKFDPKAARKDPTLHAHARQVLLKRYQSKFTFDFLPYNNRDMSTYDFIWVEKGVLEAKVLDDIMFVRERFAYAGKDEPTDQDLIRWYDAEAFDGKKAAEADEVTMVADDKGDAEGL